MSQLASTRFETTPASLSPPASLPSSPHTDSPPAPSTLTSHFVQALHDYLPSNAPQDDSVSCLFFRKGAIIEVFNRDSSGWWDGLYGGVRGWFPSNYVGRIGEAVRDSADFDRVGDEWNTWQPPHTIHEDDEDASTDSPSQAFQQPIPERANNRVDLARALLSEDRRRSNTTATLTATHRQTPLSYSSTTQKQLAIPAWENLMEDVAQRMSDLIEACATSNGNIQAVIFQVVSSIRAVLTAANTVSNDSPILKMYPELARQRKVVLSTLSKMVLKGREIQNASGTPVEEQIPEIARQLLLEMDLFEETLRSVPYFHDSYPASPRSSVASLENPSLRQQLQEARVSSGSLIAKAVPFSDAQHILQTIATHQTTIRELIMELLVAIEHFLKQRQHATEMLEMTRRVVEAVRTFLAVVEHVCSNIGEIDYKHHSIIPKDPQLVALVLAKESVYSAITNLVTTVRALAGPRGRKQDDFEHLRLCCDNVIHTTNESADCVRACFQADNEREPPKHVEEMRDHLERSVDLRRNQTLSILGRKMTSLNVLQHQYEQEEHAAPAVAEQHEPTEPGESTYDPIAAASADPLPSQEQPVSAKRLDDNEQKSDPEPDKEHEPKHTPNDEQQVEGCNQASPEEPMQQFKPIHVDMKDVDPSAKQDKPTAVEHVKTPDSTPVDEKEVEILDIAQGDDKQKTQPIPLAEAVRRSKALLKEHQRSSKTIRQGIRGRDTIRRSNATRVSTVSTNSASSASLHRQSIESLSPQTHSETTSLVSEDEVRHQLPPPPPPLLPPKAPVDLKMSSSKSTPTDQTGRARRSRGMSVSTLRMSLKKAEGSRLASSSSSETLSNASQSRGTSSSSSSWVSMKLIDQREAPEAKKSQEPEFLKQREIPEEEIIFNAEGCVIGATVRALVENLTLHEKSPDLVITRAFLHNFRLFTDPETLVQLLRDRFALQPPPGLSDDEVQLWTQRVLVPVRLRVYNVIKSWLDNYFYYEQDRHVENQLVDFVSGPMAKAMPAPASRLIESIRRAFATPALGSIGRKYGSETRMALQKAASGSHVSLSSGSSSLFSSKTLFEEHPDIPPPNITRSLRNTLRKCLQQGNLTSIHFSEFDCTELARQLTLMESALFCKIQPNEMIGQEFKKKLGVSTAIHVKAMIQRSTQITSWVADTILKESDVKKRAQIIKLWIKLGDACLQLNNYNTLMAIRSALDSTSIARLRKTWDAVSAKYKAMYSPIHRATDSDRNFAEYRRRLKSTVAPCLPFLGVYLTDMTFIDDGNANFRTTANGTQLINFDKYIKTTRILNEIEQFQIPYKLTEVEEIQRYLLQCLEMVEQDDQAFYARSLQLEPREEEFDVKAVLSSLS